MKNTIIVFLASISMLCSCDDVLFEHSRTISVKEGKHAYKPYDPVWNDDEKITFWFTLNESLAYELGNNDQCDWSKLCGYSFHKHTNHKNSIMVAMRYDRKGVYVFAPYYHEEKERFDISRIIDPQTGLFENYPCTQLSGEIYQYNGSLAIEAELWHTIRIDWNITGIDRTTRMTVTNETTGDSFYYKKVWNTPTQRKREINTWQGGNRPAIHEMYWTKSKTSS